MIPPSLQWHKSSYSGENGGCVEVATNLPAVVAVRDSTDPNGPALAFSSTAWKTFINKLKNDELHPTPDLPHPNG